MNPSDLPSPWAALLLALFAAPFVWVALRRAWRVIPAGPRSEFRWTRGEALAVIATPFVLMAMLTFVLPREGRQEHGAVLAIVASQLLLGAAAGLALFFARRRRGGLASLGLRTPPAAFGSIALVYGPGFVAGLGLMGAWQHVCRAFQWEERQEVMRMMLELEHGELFLAALIAGLIGPLIEELLFRGFLQTLLEDVIGHRAALFSTSALFAILHGMAGLPVLFLLSLLLGWLQQRTRSVWVPWSAHALNNSLMLTLALALRDSLDA